MNKCIQELKKDEAYGPDLIHNQMLINGGPALYSQLLKLFNRCLHTGTFPKLWNFANVCPIPKPGKNHSDPKNFPSLSVHV